MSSRKRLHTELNEAIKAHNKKQYDDQNNRDIYAQKASKCTAFLIEQEKVWDAVEKDLLNRVLSHNTIHNVLYANADGMQVGDGGRRRVGVTNVLSVSDYVSPTCCLGWCDHDNGSHHTQYAVGFLSGRDDVVRQELAKWFLRENGVTMRWGRSFYPVTNLASSGGYDRLYEYGHVAHFSWINDDDE